jgi:hypothetical protein
MGRHEVVLDVELLHREQICLRKINLLGVGPMFEDSSLEDWFRNIEFD